MTASTASARMWTDQLLAWMTDRGLLRMPGEPAFTSAATPLSELLAHPAARAIVLRHLPQVGASERMPMIGAMTLRQLRGVAPQVVPEAILATVDAELARLK